MQLLFSFQRVCLGPPLSLVLHWSLMSSCRDGFTSTSEDSKCYVHFYLIIIVRFMFINCTPLVSMQPPYRIRTDAEVPHLRASSPECGAHWRLQIGGCYVCRCRKQVWFAPPQVQVIRHCYSKGSSDISPSCDLVELYSASSRGNINQQVPL